MAYTTLIVLPDGTELFSGVDQTNAIQSCNITYSSNDGDDLMLGSVCSACLEAKVFSSTGDFSVAIGDVLTVCKVDDAGNRTQIGVFNAETPTKVSEHIYKITAYDNVRKLDVDMTEWLRGLTEWPYAITDFYSMICEACGLKWNWNSWSGIKNFKVYQFDVEKNVTGRQLVSWCAEVMGDYCVALPNGALSCNWYRTSYFYLYPSEKSMPSGHEGLKQLYYQGSLSYEDFEVQDVNIVQLRKDDSEDAELWPDYGNLSGVDITNPYIITGNPILLNHPTYLTASTVADSVRNALEGIADRFDYSVYRPYKVEIPEFLEAQVGRYAFITCAEGEFITPITSLVWTGHKMKLECTAKKTRENAGSSEYKTNKQLMDYSDQTAKKAASAATANLAIYKSCSDCNEATTPGFYYLSGSDCVNYPTGISSGNYGVLLVEKRFGNIYQTVKYNGYVARRYSIRDENDINTVASWSEWEYENPPMVPGTEYRTTKRYNGKAIYTKAVEFGALPNATAKTVSCGAVGANVVSWQAVILSGTNNAGIFPWYDSSGNLLAMAYINSSGSIYVKTFSDQSAATAKFIIEYVKE